ncbi:adenylosuccinate lyase [Aquirufa nivalisilvae]|uniref:adenylosuccinate lyase n=1 Tax=Aquirufa nivalisilvae TaxID=2516557 RepID=UPI0022A8EE85|nr:adenylosuccinate lyase [Aquirufa nivalisilvae]MCZ2478699.1 adenylosuccinate lyase [Aquirufa nivalisilvae]MCZ2483438.1 adenylosuccinate lyase [Aquirufa nivalisilvae]
MELNRLSAISPVDGRYRKQTEVLSPYFSEFGLIQYRVRVEIEYFIALCEIPLAPLVSFPSAAIPALRSLYQNFSEQDALWIKEKEKETNHDVKAVEYFIKDKIEGFTQFGDLGEYLEFIHFGLTSQDINNTAIPVSILEAHRAIIWPTYIQVKEQLAALAADWKDIPMLAHTHGQPASPTRLGKEIQVFVERLDRQLELLDQVPFTGKFGGATGNFNAHHVAFPMINWPEFGANLLESKLGIQRSKYTTQIEHYDNLAAYFDGLKRLNTILVDLARDIWSYVSMGYFKQKIKAGEIGSSAMPHKVNPIDFENAEGNLAIANALLEFLSAKLPISRLQRDLTDSTVLRNVGTPLAHILISLTSLQRGLGKLELNESKIHQDLEENWVVIAEAIQTVLRRESYPKPYEALKELTRHHGKIDQAVFQRFIQGLAVSDAIKAELLLISPFNFVGRDEN